MLNHSSIEHARRHIPPPAFLLQGMKTLENDTFPLGETVSDAWEIVTRVAVVHMSYIRYGSTNHDGGDVPTASCKRLTRVTTTRTAQPAESWSRTVLEGKGFSS